jgi:hypothetical protein
VKGEESSGMNNIDFFIAENLIPDSLEEHFSPSRKYKLTVVNYKTLPERGDYSLAKIYLDQNERELFEVKRNYGHFPFCFVEKHPAGHDYLICGENYQGQTILELDTGKRIDYLPEGAKKGVGFCWTDISASIEKDVLAVEGCFWACPYAVRFIDFSEPMQPPFLVLSEIQYARDNPALHSEWSAIKGVQIVASADEGHQNKEILWQKPNYADVAEYWKIEAQRTKPESFFYTDIETQLGLALRKI